MFYWRREAEGKGMDNKENSRRLCGTDHNERQHALREKSSISSISSIDEEEL